MQVANRGAEPAGSVGSPGSSAQQQQEKNQQQQQQQIEMKQESSGSTPAPFPVPSGVEADEYETVRESIARHHTYEGAEWDKCCHSMMFQRINARADVVWSVVSRFDKPQTYKHFVRSCSMKGDGKVGSVREVCVVSGLPAETSTERLDVLDEERHVMSFSVVGGEHRLRNYRSVTTLHEFVKGDGSTCTVVLESYVVDVPEGNTRDDTCLFADTVVRCNLQSLAQLAEHLQQGRDRRGA